MNNKPREAIIRNISQKPILPETINLSFEVALLETEEDSGISEKIPGISFEVRLSLGQTLSGVTDENGIFVVKDIGINYESGDRVIIEASASYDGQSFVRQDEVDLGIGKQLVREAAENRRQIQTELQGLVQQINQLLFYNDKTATTSSIIREFIKHSSEPYILSLFQQIREEILVKHIDLFKHETWALEVIMRIISTDNTFVVKTLVDNFTQYYDMPWAENVVLLIARTKPQIALDCLPNYQHQPYVRKIVAMIISQEPSAIMRLSPSYGQETWFRDVVKESLLRDVDVPILLQLMNDFGREEWWSDIVSAAAARDPKTMLESADIYKSQPWGTRILEDIVRNISATPSGNQPNKPLRYQVNGTKDDVSVRPCSDIAAQTFLMHYLEKWIHLPLAENILLRIARENPELLMHRHVDINRYEWAKQVFMAVLEGNPDVAARYPKIFDNFAKGNSVYNNAAAQRINDENRRLYKKALENNTASFSDIEAALETDPLLIVKFSGRLKKTFCDCSRVDEIIREACEKTLRGVKGNQAKRSLKYQVNGREDDVSVQPRTDIPTQLFSIDEEYGNGEGFFNCYLDIADINQDWIGTVFCVLGKRHPEEILRRYCITVTRKGQAPIWKDAFYNIISQSGNVGLIDLVYGHMYTPESSELLDRFISRNVESVIQHYFVSGLSNGNTDLKTIILKKVAERYPNMLAKYRNYFIQAFGGRSDLERILRGSTIWGTIKEIIGDIWDEIS